MRLHFAALVLLLEAKARGASASSATASVSYGDGGGTTGNKNRELRLIDGVDPGVDIFYDGTTANCPAAIGGTGRRFDAEQSTDPDCATPGKRYDMVFSLDIGDIKITSCPLDKVIKINLDNTNARVPSPPGVTSDGDKNFLLNTQKDLLQQPHVEDKESVVAMAAKAIELLVDWPAWLPFDYDYQAGGWSPMQANDVYQRSVVVIDENNVETVHEKPAEKLVYSDCYNSLCFATNNYVESVEDPVTGDAYMAAKVNMDPACAGDSGMLVGATVPPGTCSPTAPPLDGMDPAIMYANGNCMGRCGAGCGAHPDSPRQFTNDCLDYDLCARFGIDREFDPRTFDPPDPLSCTNEFLYTIDDTLWSGNCDLNTGLEVEIDPCTGLPPVDTTTTTTTTTVPANPSPPSLTLGASVVITAIQGGSCDQACGAASGSWACTVDSLSEQSFRFEGANLVSEVQNTLGLACDSVQITEDPLGSTTARVIADVTGGETTFTCVASATGRGEIDPIGGANFDCAASVGPLEVRLCSCYST